ncbi:MAG: type II toxin-antitoxin system VapC family toxin [bacterium]|nr:type II toxin-antitoxin system VapC family toxin [bacterium]
MDASVAIKWFYAEGDSDKALELLNNIHVGRVRAVAPDLIIYEVSNALWKGKKAPKARILEALDDLYDSPLKIVRLKHEIIKLSVDVMTKYDLSFYDSVYAGLAALLDIPLITANPKHHGKVKEIKVLSLK